MRVARVAHTACNICHLPGSAGAKKEGVSSPALRVSRSQCTRLSESHLEVHVFLIVKALIRIGIAPGLREAGFNISKPAKILRRMTLSAALPPFETFGTNCSKCFSGPASALEHALELWNPVIACDHPATLLSFASCLSSVLVIGMQAEIGTVKAQ